MIRYRLFQVCLSLWWATLPLSVPAQTQTTAIPERPESSESSQSTDASPQFAWDIIFPGSGIGLGAGVGIKAGDHRVLATLAMAYFPISGVPYSLSFRTGIQWYFADSLVWPEYRHYTYSTMNYFVRSTYIQGASVEVRHTFRDTTDTLFPYLGVTSTSVGGIFYLPRTTGREGLYTGIRLRTVWYQSSLFNPLLTIETSLYGGVMGLLNSNDIAYATGLSVPIGTLNRHIYLTPVVRYASHNSGPYFSQHNNIGFNALTTFDLGFFSIRGSEFVSRTRSQFLARDGNLSLALYLKGVLYPFERLYLPLLSGVYLSVFSDLIYIADTFRLSSPPTLVYTIGGGVGLEWVSSFTEVSMGYESGVGFRFSFVSRFSP